MLAITITGFLGGLSGAVAALQIGYLTPEGVFLNVPLLVVVSWAGGSTGSGRFSARSSSTASRSNSRTRGSASGGR